MDTTATPLAAPAIDWTTPTSATRGLQKALLSNDTSAASTMDVLLRGWFAEDRAKSARAPSPAMQLGPPTRPVAVAPPAPPLPPPPKPVLKAARPLTYADVESLWRHVARAAGNTDGGGGGDLSERFKSVTISPTQWTSMQAAVPSHLKPYLATRIFLRLPKSPAGEISAAQWMTYVLERSTVYDVQEALRAACSDGHQLLESEWAQFCATRVTDETPSDATAWYVDTTYARVADALGLASARPGVVGRAGRPRAPIPLGRLLYHPIVIELAQRQAWCDPEAAVELRESFTSLDTDGDGLLSRAECQQLCNGVLTSRFLDQLVAAHGGRGLTWPAYLAFQVAASDVHRPASIQYLFHVLDVDGTGVVDEYAVRAHATGVLDALEAMHGESGFEVDDVVNEVFDMARCATTRMLTARALVACGVGGTVLRILVDMHGLLQYDAYCSSGSGGGGGSA